MNRYPSRYSLPVSQEDTSNILKAKAKGLKSKVLAEYLRLKLREKLEQVLLTPSQQMKSNTDLPTQSDTSLTKEDIEKPDTANTYTKSNQDQMQENSVTGGDTSSVGPVTQEKGISMAEVLKRKKKAAKESGEL